jgi:hypothetical protein
MSFMLQQAVFRPSLPAVRREFWGKGYLTQTATKRSPLLCLGIRYVADATICYGAKICFDNNYNVTTISLC